MGLSRANEEIIRKRIEELETQRDFHSGNARELNARADELRRLLKEVGIEQDSGS